jgi:hypothetical protein
MTYWFGTRLLPLSHLIPVHDNNDAAFENEDCNLQSDMLSNCSTDDNAKKDCVRKMPKKEMNYAASNKAFNDDETALLLCVMRKIGKSWADVERLFNEDTIGLYRKKDNL